MAEFVFNISKGRAVELYNRVKSNDPSTSALIVVVLAFSGLESQEVLEDADTLTAVVAGTTNEVTGTGWNRKTFTDVELAALPAPDDISNRYEVSLPGFNWTPDVAADDSGAFVVCYDANTGSGTDADLVPLTHHDFVHFTDGNQAVMNSGVFFRAASVS